MASLLLGAGGCRRLSEAGGGRGEALEADQPTTADDVIRAYRACLAVVQTTWEQRSGRFGGWTSRGTEGTGLVVSSDGRSALVLISRHVVDPRYEATEGPRTRNVSFRVRVGPSGSGTPWTEGRLVAVYIHNADLALLRIPAPAGEAFAIPLGRGDGLRAGDEVLVVGHPTWQGLIRGRGVINGIQDAPTLGLSTLRVEVTEGQSTTAGLVFTRQGGRLIGIIRAQADVGEGETGDLLVISTDMLRKREFWRYLINESQTRRLLARL
ncbi:MAG: S1 family peptidase [Planctomycetota bacterium]